MTKLTKTLRGYIKHLFFAGIVCFFYGLFMTYLIFSHKHQEDWYVYYIPFNILGAVIGYMWAKYWSPGGAVTFRFFSKDKPTEDEIALHNLIVKYRNKTLILLVPIVYILMELMMGISRYQTHAGYANYLDGFFGNVIFSFWVVVTMSTVIKFLSA